MRAVGIILGVLAVLAVVALLTGVHWYVWRRLVRDTMAPKGLARRAGTVAVIVLPLMAVGSIAAERAGAPFLLQQVLAWPGFLWLALLLYVVLALVVGEALRPLLLRWLPARRTGDAESVVPDGAKPTARGDGQLTAAGATEPTVSGTVESTESTESTKSAGSGATEPGIVAVEATEPAEPMDVASSRRLFVARTVAVAASAAALGTVGYGTYGVLRGPTVKRLTVPLAKLPRAAHGFRIAVVSDIHLGPTLGRAHSQRIVQRINATRPDLIAVVGDLVDGDVDDLAPAARPLADLDSRLGTFFVTGNHEYLSGADQWVEHVQELGMNLLANARTELPHFDVAGVNDVSGERYGHPADFEQALGDRDTSRAVVLLAHQPVAVDRAVEYGVDLQLSGHTHGGQLWPGNYIAEIANPTVAGLDRYGDTQLYVTRGAGAWGPPTRVGAPSDITVIELASKQS